ncbi:hypothetical protein BK120_30355 [Paenibacillus sp. FSL A5-0031]|nr:hypothetical protein BK120_30355 [Paenibacillus sp. FSL A5-0031]
MVFRRRGKQYNVRDRDSRAGTFEWGTIILYANEKRFKEKDLIGPIIRTGSIPILIKTRFEKKKTSWYDVNGSD